MTSWNAAQSAQDNYSSPVARKDLGVVTGSAPDVVGYDIHGCRDCGYQVCSCPKYATGLEAAQVEKSRASLRRQLEESEAQLDQRRMLYWAVNQLVDGKTLEYTNGTEFMRKFRVRKGQMEIKDSNMNAFAPVCSFATWFLHAEGNGYGKPQYRVVKSEP